jgi:Tol biopolymer transport system component
MGGALLKYYGFDIGQNYYCGILSSDGYLLSKDIYNYGNDQFDSALHNCPDIFSRGNYPIYSPDGNRYAYYQYLGHRYTNARLVVGDLSTGKYLYSNDFSKYNSKRNAVGVPYPPFLYWLDNNRLFFVDKNTDDLIILRVDNGSILNSGKYPSAISDFYSQGMEPSPDGKFILIQSGKSGSINLFLVNTDGSGEKNLTGSLGLKHIYGSLEWSPDGTRFAFHSDLGLFIMSIDGSVINMNNGSEPKWSPDGKHLAYTCNTAISFNLCISDTDGENSVKFTSRYEIWGVHTTWSPDSKKILYLSGMGSYYQVHILWLDTSEDKIIFDINRQLTWDNPTDFNWSPDSQWLLITGIGPVAHYIGSSDFIRNMPLLCNLVAECHDFSQNGLTVIEASWAISTASWHLQNILPQSDPKLGTQTFLDNMTTLDNSIWNTNGKISIASSNVGTVTRLIADVSNASLTKNTSLNTGVGILVRLRFDLDVIFHCGISNMSSSKQGQYGVLLADGPYGTADGSFQWKLADSSNNENLSFHIDNPNSNRWYYLFLRVRNNDQVEAYLIDPTVYRVINGFSLARDQNWSNQNWVFSCQVDKGTLDLYHYEELDFQSP